MFVIGITGGSGSGKTTVVKRVLTYLPPKGVAVLYMDSYYKDNSHLKPEERTHINFDHPDAFEFDLLYQHLSELNKGNSIEAPTYDFITSTRNRETAHIAAAPVIIVEGILLFTDKRLRDLCHVKVFVDAEPDDRVIRIIKRDMEQRGRNVEDVLNRYEVVKNMHRQFVEPTKRFADIIIPEGAENQVAIDLLVATIRMKLQQVEV